MSAAPRQPHEEFERTLRNLASVGRMIEVASGREVWLVDHAGKRLRIHFHSRGPGAGPKTLAGGPAVREFFHLQQLQKAKIPAPRPTALLQGFRLDERVGDAVLLEDLPDAEPLGAYLSRHRLAGKTPPNRPSIERQLRAILKAIGALKLGNPTLRLDSFSLRAGELFYTDATGLRPGGLRTRDVQHLAHTAREFATRTDLLRAWDDLGPGGRPPPSNPVSERIWKRAASARGTALAGRLEGEGWRGFFAKTSEHPVPWSAASRLRFSEEQWRSAWSLLLLQIQSEQVEYLKRDSSGDVMLTEIVMQGRPIRVVVKRPRRSKLLRYFTDLFRPSRVSRVWAKAWKLTLRGIPVEWPMLVMQKKFFGYPTDMLIVFEHVPGQLLSRINLDELEPPKRERLFFRTGRVLRRIEDLGFTHFDAKSTNWIIHPGPGDAGPLPVLLDLDGVRHYRWRMAGIERLLRAMKTHMQYTPNDSYWLCKGYAPRARLIRGNDEVPNQS